MSVIVNDPAPAPAPATGQTPDPRAPETAVPIGRRRRDSIVIDLRDSRRRMNGNPPDPYDSENWDPWLQWN